jgi:hypothetical protein
VAKVGGFDHSQFQRAMIGAQLANAKRGGDAGVHKSNPPIGGFVDSPYMETTGETVVKQAEAAKQVGASTRSMQRAAKVATASPVLAKAVVDGDIGLAAATTLPARS